MTAFPCDPIWEFPKLRGTLFWCPYDKDPTIWGTIFVSPIFGNSHIWTWAFWYPELATQKPKGEVLERCRVSVKGPRIQGSVSLISKGSYHI